MNEPRDPHPMRDEQPVMPPLRRRPRRRRSVYVAPMRRMWTLVLWAIVLLLGIAGVYRFVTTARYAITLNGKALLVFDTREGADAAILGAKRRFAPAAPEAVRFAEGELVVKPVRSLPQLVTPDGATTRLTKGLTASVEGYAIVVNRKPLILLGSRAEASRAIALMQAAASRGKRGYPTFKERVVIKSFRQAVGVENPLPIMTAEETAKELAHAPRQRYWTVERGDSFYRIAMNHDTTVDEIKKLNPTVNPGALRIGDPVRLPDIPAPITIVMKESQ